MIDLHDTSLASAKLAGIAATVAVHLWRGNLFLSLFVGTGVCVVLANGWLAHFFKHCAHTRCSTCSRFPREGVRDADRDGLQGANHRHSHSYGEDLQRRRPPRPRLHTREEIVNTFLAGAAPRHGIQRALVVGAGDVQHAQHGVKVRIVRQRLVQLGAAARLTPAGALLQLAGPQHPGHVFLRLGGNAVRQAVQVQAVFPKDSPWSPTYSMAGAKSRSWVRSQAMVWARKASVSTMLLSYTFTKSCCWQSEVTWVAHSGPKCLLSGAERR